jgi:hypothetical protein
MSVRLSVFNLPAGLGLKDFADPFSRLPGFKNADLVTGPNNQTYSPLTARVGGIVEFLTYETADMAKRHMAHHRFPGSSSGIGNPPSPPSHRLHA